MAIWWAEGSERRECAWAAALAALPGALIVAPRFGASDCGCPGHLVSFAVAPDFAVFATLTGTQCVRCAT